MLICISFGAGVRSYLIIKIMYGNLIVLLVALWTHWYIGHKWTALVLKGMFIHILNMLCVSVCVVASTFPATEWSEWRIIHGASWVPSPHSALPVLHWPAAAFPSYPLLLLPGPAALQPSYVPLPSSRLPSSQCRHSPKEAGANHWGGVPGLFPVRGEVELTLLAVWPSSRRAVKLAQLVSKVYCELGKQKETFSIVLLRF